MFKQLQALDSVKHRALRFDAGQSYLFAAQEMLVPVFAGEIPMVAREYPIVFMRDSGLPPSALVGVQEGINAFVTPSGHWMARYVPAHVRRFPFQLAQVPDDAQAPVSSETGTRQLLVVVDAEAPHLKADAGERLFDEQGKPTPTLEHVQKVLMSLQRDAAQTRALVKQIEDAGLLVERTLHVQPKEGKGIALEGLRIVDAKAFAECGEAKLKALHESGALQLVYAHLASLSNLQDSPLVGRRTPAQVQMNDNALDFSGVDWSKLQ